MSAARDQSLAEVSNLCGMLSDATRMQILLLLAKSDRHVTGLCKDLKRPEPNVSHHLGLLRMNGVVVANRKGKQIIYSLAENVKVSGGKLKISLPSATVTLEVGGR